MQINKYDLLTTGRISFFSPTSGGAPYRLRAEKGSVKYTDGTDLIVTHEKNSSEFAYDETFTITPTVPYDISQDKTFVQGNFSNSLDETDPILKIALTFL